MKKGLVLGKFMPLHIGHLALIHFAVSHCDELIVLLCYNTSEPIGKDHRLTWLKASLQSYTCVKIHTLHYDEHELSGSSAYSETAAGKWALVLKDRYRDVNIFFSSEAYGDTVARVMNIEHKCFDLVRKTVPVSASQIRTDPTKYWDYLPTGVQPHFVRKVCLAGSESTGKSTLAEKLAKHFNTVFVPEMAREVIGHTDSCTYDDLYQIASLQAQTIINKHKHANRTLFCDTDVNVTKSYARYLFAKELEVPQWIEAANNFDLYLFLETDCPYIQDGTRLNKEERDELSAFHKVQLEKAGVPFININGDWDQRFESCCRLIKEKYY